MKFPVEILVGSAMRILGRASLELTKTAADDGKPVAEPNMACFERHGWKSLSDAESRDRRQRQSNV